MAGYTFADLEHAFQSDPMLGQLITSIEQPKGKIFKYNKGSDIYLQRGSDSQGFTITQAGELAPNETGELAPENTLHLLTKIKVTITYDLSAINQDLIDRITAENIEVDETLIEQEPTDAHDDTTLEDFTGQSIAITAWCKIHDIYRLDLADSPQATAYIKLFADSCIGIPPKQLANQLKLVKIFKQAGLKQESVTQPKIYEVQRSQTSEILQLVAVDDCSDKTYAKNEVCYQFH